MNRYSYSDFPNKVTQWNKTSNTETFLTKKENHVYLNRVKPRFSNF